MGNKLLCIFLALLLTTEIAIRDVATRDSEHIHEESSLVVSATGITTSGFIIIK